ncbi:MAG: 3-phosphoserine/phosphohydroxythreonine transaminase [Deltaproteobacteria bacterium]|nr:3-phosphoserine/phosphohydroxythreonine transaminase [Deltaproteobacteria bacterium]
MTRKHNFYAGPAVLPVWAVEKAQSALMEYMDSGVGITEMSHRTTYFDDILNGAIASVKKLYKLSDDYHVLFVQGGASMVMAISALNFCREGKKSQFVDTGTWSRRAILESSRTSAVTDVIWSGKDVNYSHLPDIDSLQFDDDASFVHITSNNTIAGTQYKKFPSTKAPLFVDMSSDFFSRPVDASQFSLIYGGLQKNLGPAGAAMVIVHKDMLEKIPQGLSEMLDLGVYAKKNSIYNTPPVFTIFVTHLVLRWIDEVIGGLENMHNHNLKKAAYIYDAIDESNGFYSGAVDVKDDRSLMNITFKCKNEELDKLFLKETTALGFMGLKGHRSVGGLRASTYNSCPMESANALGSFMTDFAKKHG